MNYWQYAIALIVLVWFNHFQTYEAEPIRGGHFDEEEEAIWVVSIQRKVENEWKHICSGSLINQRDVVTAAHCFVRFTCHPANPGIITITDYRDLTKEEHRIVIGLNDLKEMSENRGIKKNIKRLFFPNDHRPSSSIYKKYSDIAVLRFDSALNKNDAKLYPNEKYGFISLPDGEDRNVNFNGREGFAAGYGAVDAKRSPASNVTRYKFNGLRKIVKVHFLPTQSRKFPKLKNVRYMGEAPTAQGFAKGDSGGPLYMKDETKNLFKLMGVMSLGPCDGDMRNNSGKVTFVPEYLEFLNTVTTIDRNRKFDEKSIRDYDRSGLDYFVLPDHNKIAWFKLFFGGRFVVRSSEESPLKSSFICNGKSRSNE